MRGKPRRADRPRLHRPFRFTGVLHQVTFDLSGDLMTDSEAEMRVAMSRH